MRRRLALAALAAAAFGATGTAAYAFYGNGAEIVSVSLERLEQGDDGSSLPAISRDGRYVAFQTRARNFFADEDPDPAGHYRVGGIFRRDLETGRLELVADGDVRREEGNELVVSGAQNPSISASGRHVVFATAQRLVPQDTNDHTDVYVRDMSVPVGPTLSPARRAPGAYELASAKDGGDAPASYEPRSSPLRGGSPGGDVWPGAAISAGGGKVVFRTVEQASDLPDRATIDTPPGQVLVRDLRTKRTELVTCRREAATGGCSRPASRLSGVPAGGALGPAGISGDGSAVAWTGQNAPSQARFLPGEQLDDFASFYLWRRVADGRAAPTRRVTGIADPDDPSCPPGGRVEPNPTATGPCYGPLTDTEEGRIDISQRLPALSGDGFRVAFVASGGPRPLQTPSGLDLFVTDMSPGVSRKAGTRELTREGGLSSATDLSVEGAVLSADGRHVAFTTPRTQFVLPRPAPVGTFRRTPNARELYVADLAADTIERVVRAYNGGDAAGETENGATISEGGARVAFASTAANLFFGDANERQDVFVATRTAASAAEDPAPAAELSAPLLTDLGAETSAAPRLGVRARRSRRGSVRLLIDAPAAGTVSAVAKATVRARRGRRGGRATVSRARGRAETRQRLTLTLRPAKRYRALVRSRKGLAAEARVIFSPSVPSRARAASLRVLFREGPKGRRRR